MKGSALLTLLLLLIGEEVARCMALKDVLVIGSGAAGLSAARFLKSAGLTVSVYEKTDTVGGVWKHRPGRDGGPMYSRLRTNLPKEIMSYLDEDADFPQDVPSFPTHGQIQKYLEAYAVQHSLLPLICMRRMVTEVRLVASSKRWSVVYQDAPEKKAGRMIFDAVVIANGHYDMPSMPSLPGMENYSGQLEHSKAYDLPEQYQGQNVLCVGARSSGTDLAREISAVAQSVHVCDNSASETSSNSSTGATVWRHPAIRTFSGGKTVEFVDGCQAQVDTVIMCTGYDYSFPFLDGTGLISSTDRCVTPLYEQLFHVEHTSLCFMGLPHSVVPFPLFSLQARLVAAVYSGRVILPSASERMALCEADKKARNQACLRTKDAHYLGSMQWDYNRRLAKLAGVFDEELDAELRLREGIYNYSSAARPAFPGAPDVYRDRQYSVDRERGVFSSSLAK
jgi:thioredoxin reductase